MANAQQILQNNLRHTLFSWTKQSGLNPISIEKAEGVYLYERSGKRILDFSSQLMNVNVGHGHPRVLEAVTQQMKEVSYVYPGMVTRVRGELGQRLAEISPPGLTRTFFTLGGAEAVENAVKLARVVTGRHKIITQYLSFHGATYGAFSAGGDPRRLAVDSQAAPNFIHVENPYVYRCPWGTTSAEACSEMAAAHVERIIKYEGPQNIAALVYEGESGSSGCIKYPAGYLKKLNMICDRYGILWIDDEVMSGFGRTGRMFAIEHHDVIPDIMCMAKGLTCGYIPLGGLIVKEEIAQKFDNAPLPLGLTYSAHAVACAAGLACLDIYKEENLIDRAAEMGNYVDTRAAEMMKKHPSIGDWRNTGLLGCFELVKNRKTKEPMAPWNAKPDEMVIMNQVAAKLAELGLFTFVRWSYIFVAPPLNITREQIDEGFEMISQAIAIADQHVN